MSPSGRPRAKKPLDPDSLRWFALRYVERFATTRARLETYLKGKLREHGWAGEGAAPVAAVAARLVELGYVDDRAYGEAKARALQARGYGARRVGQALTGAGVDPDLRAEIGGAIDAEAAALAYARRKRIGRFGPKVEDHALRRKQLAAMLRAGHDFAIARAVLGAFEEDEEA